MKAVAKFIESSTPDHSNVGDYLKDVRDEFLDIFVGPEGPLSEIRDLGPVLYLLQLRLIIENPRLGTALNSLPRY